MTTCGTRRSRLVPPLGRGASDRAGRHAAVTLTGAYAGFRQRRVLPAAATSSVWR